jgi:hypothetical protein
MGANLIVEGEYDPNADMLIFNHQSIMDIVLFEAIASRTEALTLSGVELHDLARVREFCAAVLTSCSLDSSIDSN